MKQVHTTAVRQPVISKKPYEQYESASKSDQSKKVKNKHTGIFICTVATNSQLYVCVV